MRKVRRTRDVACSHRKVRTRYCMDLALAWGSRSSRSCSLKPTTSSFFFFSIEGGRSDLLISACDPISGVENQLTNRTAHLWIILRRPQNNLSIRTECPANFWNRKVGRSKARKTPNQDVLACSSAMHATNQRPTLPRRLPLAMPLQFQPWPTRRLGYTERHRYFRRTYKAPVSGPEIYSLRELKPKIYHALQVRTV